MTTKISSDGRFLKPYKGGFSSEHPETKIFTMETEFPVRVRMDTEFCFRSALQFMSPRERVIATAERHLISAKLRAFFEAVLASSHSVSMGTIVGKSL